MPNAPIKNVDTHTQTSNGWIDSNTSFSPTASVDKRSQSTSPSWPLSPAQHKTPVKERQTPKRSQSADSTTDRDSSPLPKYASSPKPINSFWYARGPPDGAEGVVPLSVEDIER